LEKYQSQEVASNKLKKGALVDFKSVSCSLLHLQFWREHFKDLAIFHGFSRGQPEKYSCKDLAS
jgi:hypothetical protein